MTKFQKQMLTIAAAGALTAVTALPALAFENEFHGTYNFNTIFSNYNDGNSGNFTPTRDKLKTNNYFEQRVRLQYIAKASDDLKLVTQFEIDNQFGKSTATTATSNKTNGVGLDADVVNIEVKHAYLDFNVGKNFNTKLGIQPYKDTVKGIFLDADIPAVMTTTKLGAYTLGLGFTRYNDDGVGRVGDRNTDVFMMDNTFAFNKDTKATFSYYFNADYTSALGDSAKLINTFALGGQTKIAGVDLSGFAAMQAGHQKNGAGFGKSTNYHGWAANVAAKANVGPGAARLGFLFTSGNNSDDAGHNKGWQGATNSTSSTTNVQSYNESGLIILARNTVNSPANTDQYIRRNITNIALAYLGYDAKLTDKFNLDGGVGFAWAPSSADAPVDTKIGKRNASDFMGTEIGLTAGYQLYKNLKLQAQAAYMVLGGYYKNSSTNTSGDPENPYTARLQARYSF
ncbi:hypothetical protein [Trichlorobacter ammonificans]|uniref:LamB porin family protein n=1 Tax=Trichlorobacter ammonificans TaxID=2916410 RepID=A0ABN8HLD1_9BACT|nr:hypothetical protein [Trichlorobacter ammonificans]CAH2032444.1 putative LamB porin family protein [Trichlorobacter ammonificans]